MKKFIISLLVLVLILLILSLNYKEETYVLQGTFLCKELPFSSMVFDTADNFTYYYYYLDSDNNQKEDKGIFSSNPNSPSNYVINSEIFDNKVISFEKNKFKITIDDNIYTFKRFHHTPMIILIDD